MQIDVTHDVFKLAQVFTISRGSRTEAKVLTVCLTDGHVSGWGECVPYARYGETLESVEAQIRALPENFNRQSLYDLLEPGAARNAVDCALWDLEAKQRGKRVWELAGLPAPVPEVTAYTLSLDTPEAMEKQAAEHGWAAVHAELAKVDPAAGLRIHPNDPQRLQRALEVYRLTGQSLSDLQREQENTAARFKGPLLQMALQPYSRALLHQRIELRFRQMLDKGLIEEVRELISEPGTADVPAMRAAGYRQVIDHLRGDLSYEQMVERSVIATRQLAKRQLTWLRSWPDLLMLEASEPDYAGELLAKNGGERSIFDQALQISQHFLLNRDD